MLLHRCPEKTNQQKAGQQRERAHMGEIGGEKAGTFPVRQCAGNIQAPRLQI